MVRLLHCRNWSGSRLLNRFQSHNGAIAARQIVVRTVREKVSIPQWCDCCANRREGRTVVGGVSIPQWCDCCLTGIWTVEFTLEFQSHNGAIAASMRRNGCHRKLRVSIPQWCDCCEVAAELAKLFKRSFNPTMVRLLPNRCTVAAACRFSFQSHNGAIAAC